MTYKPAPGLPPPFPWTDLVGSPPPLSAQNLSHGASGPSKVDKIEVQRPLATKTHFSGRDLPSFRLDFPLKSELAPAPFWLGSTDARELERH